MKAINTIVKLFVALAAVAGAIYVAATYGEQIVAWAKKSLARIEGMLRSCCPAAEADFEDEVCEAPAEEAPSEEVPEEVEIPAEEPAASEEDFQA